MKRRNKFLALILAAAVSCSFTACGSEDSNKGSVQQEAGSQGEDTSDEGSEEKTAEDVLTQAQEKMKDVKSMAAKMVMHMDMKMSAEGEEQTMQMVSNADMSCLYDPVRMKIDMDIDMGELGSTKQNIYAEAAEDGTITEYIGDGTNWQKVNIQLEDLGQYDAAKNMQNYLDSSFNFKLDGTEQVDGADAYKLSGVMTGEKIKEAMVASGALNYLTSLGMDASQTDTMLDGLGDIPLTFWIDAESSYPVKYDIDMSAVMNTLMSKMMESMDEQAQGMSIEIHKMTMEMTCSDYNEVEEFTIPEDAKKA